jgi:hypothetical protein
MPSSFKYGTRYFEHSKQILSYSTCRYLRTEVSRNIQHFGEFIREPIAYEVREISRSYGSEYEDDFWNVAPFVTLMMKAVRTSEMVVYSDTTRRYIAEGSHLRHHHCLQREPYNAHKYKIQR